jgi:hypothetical protein
MSWQKSIYTSKNNLWAWQNFKSCHKLMETDLSQFHAATTPYMEAVNQDSLKHFSGCWMGTEGSKLWPPWSLTLPLLDFYLCTAYKNWFEVWKSVCMMWTFRDTGKLVTPYALTPMWQEYWPYISAVEAYIIQNCSYNSIYFQVSLSFCASFMNRVLLSKYS